MATLGVADTQPGASQCVSSCGGHPGWVCFSMSAEAAVAEVSVPCMEPILQMCMKGSEGFFSPSVPLCSAGAFLIRISSGSQITWDHGALQMEQIGI